MTEHVVIIGAGQAGATAALKLRALGYSGSLTLVGEEEALPYQRPPLSKKYLMGEIEAQRHLKPEAAYRERAIELQLGRRVCEVARESRQITLDDHQTLPFDRLVLATGSTPNELPARLGGRLNNVFTFRTFEHAGALQSEFLPRRRLVVIGGVTGQTETLFPPGCRLANLSPVVYTSGVFHHVASITPEALA